MRLKAYTGMTSLLSLLLAVCAAAQTGSEDGLRRGPASAGSTSVGADTLASTAPAEVPPPRPSVRFPLALRSGSEAVASRRLTLELASASIGEAFSTGPGVHVHKHGGHGMPQYLSVRGVRADEIVYLLDGVPLSDSQIEALDLSRLPLAGIEKAEVLKGGLASIWGSGAIGGVLRLTSPTARPDVPESEITAWWGSYDGRAASVRFNRRISDRIGVLGTYANLGTGGWTDNAKSEAERLMGKAVFLLKNRTQVGLTGYRYRGDFQQPDSCPSLLGTSPADRGHDRDFLKVSLLSGDTRRLHICYYRLGTSDSFFTDETTYVHDGVVNGLEAGLAYQTADSAVTALAVGYRNRRMESSSLGERQSDGIYAYALKGRRGGRWKIQGSVRLAKNSDFDLQAGLGLAVRYAFLRDSWLFGRLDRSYRFPGFHVLYAGGGTRPIDSRIGTETSIGLELGAALKGGPLSFSIAVFRRDARGLARFLTDDSCRAYVDPDIDIDATGAEASLAVSLERWLEAEVSYSILGAEDGDGQKVPYLPDRVMTARAALTRSLSAHVSVGIGVAAWYVSPVEAGARLVPCETQPACVAQAELPDYSTTLVNAHVDIDRAMVFLKIHNAANASVRTMWGRERLPSRSYEFGISVLLVD